MTDYTVVTVTIVNSLGQSDSGTAVYFDDLGAPEVECDHKSLEDAIQHATNEADERASDYFDAGYPTRCFISITRMPKPKHSGPRIEATLSDEAQTTVTSTIS